MKKIKYIEFAAFFSLTFIALLALGSHDIFNANYETGDFAANSLLIQDAKNFNLFVGNYSRIGFNHPGPAILYFLAAGEFIFFDYFQMVGSAVSGQLLAVVVYSSLWATGIFWMSRNIFSSFYISMLFTLIFLMVTSFFDQRFFLGLWFPNLYYFPFAAMILGFVGFISRIKYSWIVVGFGTGFLFNGHISFVPIFVIILSTVFALIYIARILPSFRFSGISFWNAYGYPIIGSFFIILIMMLPFIWLVIVDFPGPIADYLSYSSGRKSNNFFAAISFVASYWGGVPVFILAFVLMTFILVSRNISKSEIFSKHRIAQFTIVISASTFAVLIYAIKGIDHLAESYIALFYYSIPALYFSITCLVFVQLLMNNSLVFKLLLVFFVIGSILINIAKPIDNSSNYYGSNVPRTYDALKVISNGKKIILDLDSDVDWPKVWSNVVSIMVYAKRSGDNFICINKNWHILFTKDGKCSDYDLIHGIKLDVFPFRSTMKPNIDSVASTGELLFFSRPRSIVKFNKYYSFANDLNFIKDAIVFKNGWSDFEPNFIWTDDFESTLKIPVGDVFVGLLNLSLSAYLPEINSSLKLSIFVNDQSPVIIEFSDSNKKVVSLKVNKLSDSINIRFLSDTTRSPINYGSGDKRNLGIAFYGFSLDYER